jgi:hypothetical protein
MVGIWLDGELKHVRCRDGARTPELLQQAAHVAR